MTWMFYFEKLPDHLLHQSTVCRSRASFFCHRETFVVSRHFQWGSVRLEQLAFSHFPRHRQNKSRHIFQLSGPLYCDKVQEKPCTAEEGGPSAPRHPCKSVRMIAPIFFFSRFSKGRNSNMAAQVFKPWSCQCCCISISSSFMKWPLFSQIAC